MASIFHSSRPDGEIYKYIEFAGGISIEAE